MAWYFRAIETSPGRWECRHGGQLFDAHGTLEDALAHLRSMAQDARADVELFVHTLEGEVQQAQL